MLKHNHYYSVAVRAFDVAGNTSSKLYTSPIQRINSAPEFISINDTIILFEDIAWDYDTARVTDLDLNTLQSDSFSFSIISWIGDGSDTTKVVSNPAVVDESTGLISWIPIQNDTIDQSGNYTLRFIAADQYSFFDTMFVNAKVNAVNDTPVVNILGDDEVITWNEDKPTTDVKRINLSRYGNDIDNEDNPYECGLDKYVNVNSDINFLGKDKLIQYNKNGLKKKLMGVKIESDSISITETIKIFDNNENHIGELRSGVYSPHFNKVIGIAMLKKSNWDTGTRIKININGKSVNGTVCDLPFI